MFHYSRISNAALLLLSTLLTSLSIMLIKMWVGKVVIIENAKALWRPSARAIFVILRVTEANPRKGSVQSKKGSVLSKKGSVNRPNHYYSSPICFGSLPSTLPNPIETIADKISVEHNLGAWASYRYFQCHHHRSTVRLHYNNHYKPQCCPKGEARLWC